MRRIARCAAIGVVKFGTAVVAEGSLLTRKQQGHFFVIRTLHVKKLTLGLALTFNMAQTEIVSAQAPAQVPPSGTVDPNRPESNASDVPLSKKLDKGDGVIAPPSGVDPKINKGAPAKTGDQMPVIIPPGEPGGDQSVQPK